MLEEMIATPAGVSTPEATGDDEVLSGTWEKFPEVGDEVPERYGILNASDTEWFEIEIATPEVPDTPFGFSEDFVAIVQRSYGILDPDTGDPLDEGLGANVTIAEIADPAGAGSAFASTKATVHESLEAIGVTLEPVESGIAADEVVAWKGQGEIDGQQLQLALVLVRSGPYVLLVAASNTETDPDPLAFTSALAQAIVDRDATSGPGEHNYDGTSTGGIWDKLPATGDEVLGGLVAYDDQQIHPWVADWTRPGMTATSTKWSYR
jgi:hypothetical protein